MMQNHYVISSKYHFWTRSVPNSTKSPDLVMSGPVQEDPYGPHKGPNPERGQLWQPGFGNWDQDSATGHGFGNCRVDLATGLDSTTTWIWQLSRLAGFGNWDLGAGFGNRSSWIWQLDRLAGFGNWELSIRIEV